MEYQEQKCPKCGASWDGGSMLETFIKQRDEGAKVWKGMTDKQIEEYMKKSYSPPYRWGRQISVANLGSNHITIVCPDCERDLPGLNS